MDTLIQALMMGVVQGLTEFLPISSSGHLIVVPFLLGWDDPFITSLAFSVMLHIGTSAALLVYFRSDWLRLVPAGFATIRDRSFRADPDRRLAWLLVAATIPAAIAGFILGDVIETAFRESAWSPHARHRGGHPVARRPLGRPHQGRRGRDIPGRDRDRSGAGPRPDSGHQPVGDQDLRGPVRRARPRGRRTLLVPDGDPDHRRGGALRDPQARCRRGRRRRQPGPLVVGMLSRSCRGWSRSASCCATCARGRSTSSSAYRLVVAAVVVVAWLR